LLEKLRQPGPGLILKQMTRPFANATGQSPEQFELNAKILGNFCLVLGLVGLAAGLSSLFALP
jgi:hypothetical protein